MSQAGKVEAHSFRREFILQGLSSEPPPSDPEKEKELLEAKKASKEAGDKLVQRFIDKNKELWQRFINHGFLQQLATEAKAAKPQASVPEDPTPANSSFKEYLKQDYYYLLNLVRFRAGRLTKFRGDASLWNLKSEIAKIDSAYKFAVTFRQQCLGKVLIPDTDEYRDEKLLNDLKIDEKDLSDPNGPGVAVLGYNSFLQDRVALEEWVTLYIATIPCIYGYTKIANELAKKFSKEDKDRARETSAFYKYWIEQNLDSESADKLITLVGANAKSADKETEAAWESVFNSALKFEIALFDSVWPNKS